ncbi:F-box and leucine rich repeat protein 12 [Homo sapiens]|uniref:F-box and leucine rich repeat protein 12 n=1 Tax=Homo sapiens TaxID=9606 RepID=K7EK37_HUMAN|nr:F-box and leucine rich repeat protein 12 [Homo sapiens]KAI4040242.1 F-box and leucine rich repeat protein 12 [Homo sapiens]
MATLVELPDSVLLEIFSYLPVRDRIRISRVCHRWKRLVDDRWLWRHVDLTLYTVRAAGRAGLGRGRGARTPKTTSPTLGLCVGARAGDLEPGDPGPISASSLTSSSSTSGPQFPHPCNGDKGQYLPHGAIMGLH